jgi:hypothetical protein
LEPIVKGFVCGFIVAQFISGWVSGPLIIVTLVVYVFNQHALDTLLLWAQRIVPRILFERFVSNKASVPSTPSTSPPVTTDYLGDDFWKSNTAM